VLTPRQIIADPTRMRIGIDGIYITGLRFGAPVSGCFLPQVAAEQNWDAATTLGMCCMHKLGLDADAWRPPTTLTFETFQAIVISE
jgi:AMMECR1 domain-containing protein